jgi:glucokinase
MLLAGDVGGTKTSLGLFARGAARPDAIDIRSYRTLDFPDLGALCRQFLRETSTRPSDIEAASFGVAGPVTGARAQLTNVPWVVDLDALRHEVPIPHAHLLNDLEALAWSVPVLAPDEVEVLHEGEADSGGNVALIAAGTGLGIALLPRVDGRLVPRASEGGHADFAPRNAGEQRLAGALIEEYGRVDVERVVSGPGLANIHRILHPHQCATLTPMPSSDKLPPAISQAALEGACPSCTRTLELFVSAYGAAAGNLALTALSTGGLYVGGGIAPRILPALRWPAFMRSFLEKSPMDALIARIPVRVILNPGAGLLGAATYANGVRVASR